MGSGTHYRGAGDVVALVLTVVLLFASAVLLVVGAAQNHLGYVYLSMGCAAVALVGLVVIGRVARHRAAGTVVAAGSRSGPPVDETPAGGPPPAGTSSADSGTDDATAAPAGESVAGDPLTGERRPPERPPGCGRSDRPG